MNRWMLRISTSCLVLCAPRSWLKYFFEPVLTFLVHFKTFSLISRLKSRKNFWKRAKKLCHFSIHSCFILICQINTKGWAEHSIYESTILHQIATELRKIQLRHDKSGQPQDGEKITGCLVHYWRQLGKMSDKAQYEILSTEQETRKPYSIHTKA